MTMELDDCITKDCSTIYRFQFASIAFICGIYLPYAFHSNIWSLYTQPFSPINCTLSRNPLLPEHVNNISTRALAGDITNRSICCACSEKNLSKRSFTLCQEWMKHRIQSQARKTTIMDEWRLGCGEENRKKLLLGSTSFLTAEILGTVFIGVLADQYGRKLMLLMCLYIPVLFGSLAAFTTTYWLFVILRWPVGFLNRSLLVLGFIMAIESCEYKHRAQIGCLLLASIPIYGIIIGVAYFFLLDWRYMQLFGTLVATVTLCYPWLIPESRRWFVNTHRTSRVNPLLQYCSTKPSTTLGLNKISSPTASIYDKPITKDSGRSHIQSIFSLLINRQLRRITCCLFLLWSVSSFCYQCTFFPTILPHPTMNYALMNAIEFFSFIVGLIVAYKLGRRPPLAVLILIGGLSSISLAITLLGTGHIWLETTFTLLARSCLRTCYCLLILFTSELYPTSFRATGLAISLSGEVLSRILVEILFYFLVNRASLLFISGGLLCFSCCLIVPLPETFLYDLPDSLSDLQSMKRSTSNEHITDASPISPRHHVIDSNTLSVAQEARPAAAAAAANISVLNDLSSPPPKTILKNHMQELPNSSNGKSVTIHSQPEIIQFSSNTLAYDALANPCYFSTLNSTIDPYDIEQQIDNRVVISIRNELNDSCSEGDRTKF